MTGLLTVTEVRSLEDFASLEGPWDRLLGRADFVRLASSFTFARTWWKHRSFGNNLFVLVMKDREEVVGIAPFMISEVKAGLVRARKVSFMFARYLESDFIVESGRREECVRLAVQHALRASGCHYLELSGMSEESGTLPVLRSVASEMGLGFSSRLHSGGRYIPVQGPWEAFLDRRSPGFRKDLRYYERRLAAQGKLELVRSRGAIEPKGLMDKMMAVDEASWKVGWAARPENGAWMLDLLGVSGEKGWLDAFFLELGGVPVSYLVFIRHAGRAYAMFTSYSLKLAHSSPGMVCFGRSLNTLFDENEVSEVDFLSDYPYLRSWTESIRNRYVVTLYPSTAMGQAVRLARGVIGRVRAR